MRIAITADPYIPVPPAGYGGIERVIDLLVRGLHARGHRVSLIGHPASQTSAELIPYGVPPHSSTGARMRELAQVGSVLWRRRSEWDLVHSFGRLAALVPILRSHRLAKIQTYQRQIPWKGVGRAFHMARGSLRFTACGGHMYRERKHEASLSAWSTVSNGVPMDIFQPVKAVPAQAPLCFLGRLEAIKGAHLAIEIARRAERRLVLAGNRVSNDGGYFSREIAPQIDGDQIRYVGEIGDAQKSRLLGQAAALLMPIEWEEPFGIVMVEAMACGTPVIGFARGAVPEVVEDGVTGFVVEGIDEAVDASKHVERLSRPAVRQRAERRFGAEVIVDAYESLYRHSLVGGTGP